MKSKLACAVTVGVLVLGCDAPKPDVLREFPPPRLAREVPQLAEDDAPLSGECQAHWRWIGKGARQTYRLLGAGSFHAFGVSSAQLEGEVTFRTSDSELPAHVQQSLFQRGGTVWTWRLMRGEGEFTLGELGAAPTSETELEATSEIELNAVRTRQRHRVRYNVTALGDERRLRIEAHLNVDLSAHHIHALRLPDGSPPRRTELTVACRLSAPSDAD